MESTRLLVRFLLPFCCSFFWFCRAVQRRQLVTCDLFLALLCCVNVLNVEWDMLCAWFARRRIVGRPMFEQDAKEGGERRRIGTRRHLVHPPLALSRCLTFEGCCSVRDRSPTRLSRLFWCLGVASFVARMFECEMIARPVC